MKNLLVSFMLMLCIGCNTSKKEIFIVDKNLQGYLIVVFDGKNKSLKNERKYFFSGKRIFFSDYEKSIGLTNVEAYNEDNGSLLKIPFILKSQISNIANEEKNKKYLILIGGFSSKNTKISENLSLNIYWFGEISNLNPNDANRVVSFIENNATLENLKNNTLLSLME
jgi:hypothetical protein